MKKLIALCLVAFAVQAHAATAFFTGSMRPVQTVTYQMGWACQYNYAGQMFWATFVGSCPSSIEVQ